MKNKSTLSFGIAIGIVLGAVGASLVVDKLKADSVENETLELRANDEVSIEIADPAGIKAATEKVRSDIQNAKHLLKPSTVEWAKKLPPAKTLEEEYFHLYMQIAFEKNDVDVVDLAAKNLSLFQSVKDDKEFKNYISACLGSAEVEREERVKDFVSKYVSLIY